MKDRVPGLERKVLPWPALVRGVLLRRYQRFKADVKLDDGQVVTAHCANSGSMKSCSEPGRPVYLSRSPNLKRKLPYTWNMIEMPGSLVGVHTDVPNRLVRFSIEEGLIPELAGFDRVRSEVAYGLNSRIDILLERANGEKCFVEVKNCTLLEGDIAYFPDAKTERGLKHLVELQAQVDQGYRGVMFFLIQRMDARAFAPADHIDPAYGTELRRAVRRGVEMLAYDVSMDLKGIAIRNRLRAEL
ncbi:MAG: DNA/RNA nuclease SfsA [Thermodesulfobacteriota bacterium]